MRVRPFGEYAGYGEDYPIYHAWLLRDGWILKCEGEGTHHRRNAPVRYEYRVPMIYEKRAIRKQNKYFLQMQIRGIGERQGDKYVIDREILNEKGDSLLKLARTSWADLGRRRRSVICEGWKAFSPLVEKIGRLWFKICERTD